MTRQAILCRVRDVVAITFCCTVLGVLALGLAASAAMDVARRAAEVHR